MTVKSNGVSISRAFHTIFKVFAILHHVTPRSILIDLMTLQVENSVFFFKASWMFYITFSYHLMIGFEVLMHVLISNIQSIKSIT